MNTPNQPDDAENSVSPLPGEPGIPDLAAPARRSWSKKGLLAVGLLMAAIVGVAAVTIQRFAASGSNDEPPESRRVGDRPAVASAEPRRLEMPEPQVSPPSAAPAAAPVVPALQPTEAELAEPIGVRRIGSGSGTGSGKRSIPPEDAPVMLVTTRSGARAGGPHPRHLPPPQGVPPRPFHPIRHRCPRRHR